MVREVFPGLTSLGFCLSSMASLRTRTPFPVVADQAGQGGMVPQTKLHLLRDHYSQTLPSSIQTPHYYDR